MSFALLYETQMSFWRGVISVSYETQVSSFEFRVTHEMTHHETKNKTKDGEKKQILFIFALKKLFHKAGV